MLAAALTMARGTAATPAAALVLALALCASSVAADTHEMCEEWASLGECEKNPSYMLTACSAACASPGALVSSFYDLSAKTAGGATLPFSDLEGKVVLVTNVASA